ncbi:MAG: glycoside hydrolase domain-containing protein [Luteolibacter sp.]
MSKSRRSVSCLLVVVMTIFGAAASRAATLKHHYPFNGNASDDVGTTNLTSVGDSVTFLSSDGAAGGYLKLGGSDDYLMATAGSNLSVLGDYSTFRPFSLSLWVRQTAAQGASGTIGVIGMTTESTNTSGTATPNYNTGFEVCTRESGSAGVQIRARAGSNGNGAGAILTGLNIANTAWHHLAVIFEAGGRTVYIDGVSAGSNTTAVAFSAGQPITRFAVGAFLRSNQIVDDFNGDVDDLQIYDGALTDTEALRIYQNPGLTLNDNLPPAGPDQLLPEGTPLADVVDTMIGVAGGAGTGSTVPGPCLPQSSIYPSPDTVAAAAGGYLAGSNTVGFSQLHATGSGSSTMSFGNFLVSPRIGANSTTLEDSNGSPITNVTARPYSYRGRLTTPGIDCTVVPTANCAIYQFDFPASSDARIYFDVARKLNSATGMTSGSVTVDPVNGTISGGGTFDGNWNPAAYNVYFYAKLDTTPTSGGTWLGSSPSDGVLSVTTATRQRIGSWVRFDTSTNHTVRMKIGVSFQSVAKAQGYVENEMPAWDLTGLEAAAKTRWNDTLGVVRAPGITIAEARKLYTALFHSLIQPRNRTGDPAGWAADAAFWDDQYTPWDTWQTLYPLLAIVKPDSVASIVNSFGERFAHNGKAETAFIQGKDFQVGQGGDEVDRIIADAWVKGIPGIDWEKIWPLLQFNAGRRTDDYRNLGFVSTDGSHNGYDSRMASGSSTIAFAHGDWCAAQVAAGLGHADEAQALLTRSSNWRNVWDSSLAGDGFSGFVHGKARNGIFTNVAATSAADFYQGTCWNYSFNVHDRDAMIDLMGGRARFIQRLEYAFGKNSTSYLDFGNEVNLQAVPLLSRALRPGISAYWADNVRSRYGLYNCPGDEDSGAMSSLYFFLTAGFVPAATEDTYYLHGPRVPRLEFNVGGGKTFTVTAQNAGGANLYVQSATLNGQPLDKPVIHHPDILAGSTLAFVMGPNPSIWGTAGDFSAPEKTELVLSPRQWSAARGTPQIAQPDTDSPLWGGNANGADNSAIQSAFPAVTLEEAGDSITLAANVNFSGLSVSQTPPASRFSWGLYNSNGSTDDKGWTGCSAANDTTDTTDIRHFWKKPAGNATSWHDPADAVALAAYHIASPDFAAGSYRIVLTLTRNATAGLDYHAALVRAADGVIFAAFSGADASPSSFTFDHVGLRAGDALDAGSIQLSSCVVVARRTHYSGRNLTIPQGGVFRMNQTSLELAGITNSGIIEITDGDLSVTGDISNSGTLRLKGPGGLAVGGTFTNNGTLDTILFTGSATGEMVNNGTVLDLQSVRLGLMFQGPDLALSFPGYEGHVYQIQRDASRILAGPWNNIGDPVVGLGSPIVIVIPNASAQPADYFRLGILP